MRRDESTSEHEDLQRAGAGARRAKLVRAGCVPRASATGDDAALAAGARRGTCASGARRAPARERRRKVRARPPTLLDSSRPRNGPRVVCRARSLPRPDESRPTGASRSGSSRSRHRSPTSKLHRTSSPRTEPGDGPGEEAAGEAAPWRSERPERDARVDAAVPESAAGEREARRRLWTPTPSSRCVHRVVRTRSISSADAGDEAGGRGVPEAPLSSAIAEREAAFVWDATRQPRGGEAALPVAHEEQRAPVQPGLGDSSFLASGGAFLDMCSRPQRSRRSSACPM